MDEAVAVWGYRDADRTRELSNLHVTNQPPVTGFAKG
jgi:hypothetical protein